MTVFNSTSQVILSPQKNGVILPQSSSVLLERDIDEKISHAKKHIAHLSSGLMERKTHRGTNFRAKQITLREQIGAFSERLEMLESAKEKLKEQPVVAPQGLFSNFYSLFGFKS